MVNLLSTSLYPQNSQVWTGLLVLPFQLGLSSENKLWLWIWTCRFKPIAQYQGGYNLEADGSIAQVPDTQVDIPSKS